MDEEKIRKPSTASIRSCSAPTWPTADAMFERIIEIKKAGDSSGGLVEVHGHRPAGRAWASRCSSKLDGELGRMLSIGAVKAVEIGAGVAVKDMTGSQCNDQMYAEGGKVALPQQPGRRHHRRPDHRPDHRRPPGRQADAHHQQGPGDHRQGRSRRAPVLKAVTRRDPTLVARIWPVAEAFTAMILLDHLHDAPGLPGDVAKLDWLRERLRSFDQAELTDGFPGWRAEPGRLWRIARSHFVGLRIGVLPV